MIFAVYHHGAGILTLSDTDQQVVAIRCSEDHICILDARGYLTFKFCRYICTGHIQG